MTHRTSNIERSGRTASAGDPAMIEALIQQYYAYLHRLAFSILGDDQEADDAAQESILRALQNLDRLQAETKMKSWLSIITVNIAHDLLRRRAARQRLQTLLGWSGLFPNRQESPEKTVLETETRTQLWQAVNDLDEKHRFPVILRFVHGMAVSEIAQALEVNEGTVHSRLHYAIRKLQASLSSSLTPAAFDLMERG